MLARLRFTVAFACLSTCGGLPVRWGSLVLYVVSLMNPVVVRKSTVPGDGFCV
jgi:hypothetical protein